MKRFLVSLLLGVACSLVAQAEEASQPELPFDRALINRYSLDHLPRSISIRQANDFWLGYDLERATLYKAWRAPENKSGLKGSGFVMRSVGQTLYEDKSNETWRFQHNGNTMPLDIRYLGCSQREGYFELQWELKYDKGILTLHERVPMSPKNPIAREIHVDSLPSDGQLLLPAPMQKAWKLATAKGDSASSLSDAQWYQLTTR
ncbi:hypothetical protein [Bremerella alba]|uniref:Uncharacterized protein n=1 Tax=Bremerella alba TaxID=980252 RepID=A0A7V8V3D3_9BACT|nr:hypothetical protein [Bremerella alba]MBA2114150.1 hypothetical protein [Bremerella alba]